MLANELYNKLLELSPEYRPYIPIETIAEQLNYPLKTIDEGIKNLAEQGLVTIMHGKVRLRKTGGKKKA